MTFTPVDSTSASALGSLSLEDIQQDVREDVEEAYAYLSDKPTQRLRAAFADKTAAAVWLAQANVYCRVRPAGEIRIRKSPTRNLPDGTIDFRVADLLPDNGKDEIREAVKAATAPPAKVTAKK
jgi:hypothetical protein